MHPAVEIAMDHGTGYHLRVRRGYFIVPGTCILSCPHELTLSILNMDRCDLQWPKELQLLWENSPEVCTRFFIMEEYAKNDRSFWWPYVQMLPQPDEPDTLQTPLWYGDEDCVWIQGTNLESARVGRDTLWREQYEKSMAVLQSSVTQEGLAVSSYNWWAAISSVNRDGSL